MTVGKLYSYLELWPLEYGRDQPFRFRGTRQEYFDHILLSEFSKDGKITGKEILEMLYPGYPWDVIIKLYNEAPRSQK